MWLPWPAGQGRHYQSGKHGDDDSGGDDQVRSHTVTRLEEATYPAGLPQSVFATFPSALMVRPRSRTKQLLYR